MTATKTETLSKEELEYLSPEKLAATTEVTEDINNSDE